MKSELRYFVHKSLFCWQLGKFKMRKSTIRKLVKTLDLLHTQCCTGTCLYMVKATAFTSKCSKSHRLIISCTWVTCAFMTTVKCLITKMSWTWNLGLWLRSDNQTSFWGTERSCRGNGLWLKSTYKQSQGATTHESIKNPSSKFSKSLDICPEPRNEAARLTWDKDGILHSSVWPDLLHQLYLLRLHLRWQCVHLHMQKTHTCMHTLWLVMTHLSVRDRDR